MMKKLTALWLILGILVGLAGCRAAGFASVPAMEAPGSTPSGSTQAIPTDPEPTEPKPTVTQPNIWLQTPPPPEDPRVDLIYEIPYYGRLPWLTVRNIITDLSDSETVQDETQPVQKTIIFGQTLELTYKHTVYQPMGPRAHLYTIAGSDKSVLFDDNGRIIGRYFIEETIDIDQIQTKEDLITQVQMVMGKYVDLQQYAYWHVRGSVGQNEEHKTWDVIAYNTYEGICTDRCYIGIDQEGCIDSIEIEWEGGYLSEPDFRIDQQKLEEVLEAKFRDLLGTSAQYLGYTLHGSDIWSSYLYCLYHEELYVAIQADVLYERDERDRPYFIHILVPVSLITAEEPPAE